MIDSGVAQVRSFNRLVTQRVGALDDGYLARDRPLGEARLLWEIGADGCDVRRPALAARPRLGLPQPPAPLARDCGARRGGAQPGDGRVRTARLTTAGLDERELLDRRSDELARSLLEPLGTSSAQRLVAAMAEVERLLTAALVEIESVDPAHRDARHCLSEYFAELGRRFETGFDPSSSTRAGSTNSGRRPVSFSSRPCGPSRLAAAG